MFGVGIPELLVIFLVGMLVFGPDKLPDFARQLGRMVRQVRRLSQQARDDIRTELGPDYANFELTDLDPRRAIRKHILDAWETDDDEPGAPPPQQRFKPLGDDESPPYDSDAT